MVNRNNTIRVLRSFELSDDKRSYIIFCSYLILFLLALVASVLCYQINPLLSMLFWLPIWIGLCKFFVFLHDCGHYSFFKSKRMNRIAGGISGFFILLPNSMWTKIHNSHHEVTGNLDRRNDNPGVSIMTVKEYQNASKWTRIQYRVLRSAIVRLVLIPVVLLFVGRIPFPRLGWAISINIIIHDIIYGFLIYAIVSNGWTEAVVIIFLVPLYFFYLFASMLFFLQHQYEETYWAHDDEWDLYTASIEGSSHLEFGPVMRWVTGNVGCHHIHHINSKIPYYNLQKATVQVNGYMEVKSIRLKEIFKHLSFVLWNEESKKIVRFKNVN